MADTPIVSYSSAAGPVHGDIFAGSSDVITKPGTLVSGAGAVVRGQVLALVTASGKFTKHNPGGTGGAEVAVAIAAFPADATSADAAVGVYVAGEFAMDLLVWHASTDTDAERLAAFPIGSPIIIKKRYFSA